MSFQDYFTKWPLVYPVPGQMALRLVEILTKEVIPFFGVPEALLYDHGKNLLSNLMKDICSVLQVEHIGVRITQHGGTGFNRTLKAMKAQWLLW